MTTAEGFDWMTDAACIEIGTEAFFPVAVASGPNRAATKATRICHEQCPVKADCLQYALTNGLEHGIFGGLTARERRPLCPPTGRPESSHRVREAQFLIAGGTPVAQACQRAGITTAALTLARYRAKRAATSIGDAA
jgi:WhiB family transcriptional regulator, redox-sensing transcriptional regulator